MVPGGPQEVYFVPHPVIGLVLPVGDEEKFSLGTWSLSRPSTEWIVSGTLREQRSFYEKGDGLGGGGKQEGGGIDM